MDSNTETINIILFSGVQEGPDYYSKLFADYLSERSIAYYIADVRKLETYLSSEFDAFALRPNTVMFTINNAGILLRENEVNFWKKHGIPVFDHIVDHPRNFDDSLLYPECDIFVSTLDLDHKSFIERFYPEVKEVYFMPNGGIEINKQEEYQQREIDVIYMGNCNFSNVLPNCKEFEDGGTEFYSFVSCYLLDDPMKSTEEAIEEFIKSKNILMSDSGLLDLNKKYAGYIEEMVRRHYKLEGMKALDEAGVHVHIYGKGWEDDDYRFSGNIELHGRIKRDELMDIIGQSKISLCFIPWFKKGCSEKNFDSMLNGALCVTDRSEYLEENYTDGYNIIYFDLNNPAQMAADIKWLLDNQEQAEIISKRGYYTAGKHDTWNCRFDKLIKILGDILSTYKQ